MQVILTITTLDVIKLFGECEERKEAQNMGAKDA